ncbi:MAG: prenyltransferase/squalene oxidase repeat-containing protein [Planctomycetota bacterium]
MSRHTHATICAAALLACLPQWRTASAQDGADRKPQAAESPTSSPTSTQPAKDGQTEKPATKPVAPKGAENAPAEAEITPKLEDAVRKGCEALRRMQKPDGAYGQGRYGTHIGVTSLGAIALMADGNVPGRGDYGDSVQKALDFVLANATETGLLVSDETHGPMYGHGFAALFLGEIYGMNPQDDRVRDALVRAVQLIVSSQNDEGGWRYNPVPNDADVSVTICQVMALRSARNAGIKVPKSTIDDAIRYVRECQNADGGWRYMRDSGSSAWPRSAAGVASLFYAGVYEDESIEKGLDYLKVAAFPRGGAFAGSFTQPHYFYGHYYAVQAMYLAGGERWRTWWPAIRDELIARQNPDGTWSDPQAGEAYGTAMALIILQMPKRYLPIFQR